MSKKIGFTSEPFDPDARRAWQERKSEASAHSAEHEVPAEMVSVLLKIKNLETFKSSTKLILHTVLKISPSEWIVTSRISRNQLEDLQKNPLVISIEHDRKICPTGSSAT